MKNLTPFIDETGDMHLHGREGGIAVFDFEDENRNPRDMTGASVYFETASFRKKLEPGEADSQLILILERGELATALNKRQDYVVIDETGEVPHVILEGNVIVSGWV